MLDDRTNILWFLLIYHISFIFGTCQCVTANLNLNTNLTVIMTLALQRTESTFEEIPVMSDFNISSAWGFLAENVGTVTFEMRVVKIQ